MLILSWCGLARPFGTGLAPRHSLLSTGGLSSESFVAVLIDGIGYGFCGWCVRRHCPRVCYGALIEKSDRCQPYVEQQLLAFVEHWPGYDMLCRAMLCYSSASCSAQVSVCHAVLCCNACYQCRRGCLACTPTVGALVSRTAVYGGYYIALQAWCLACVVGRYTVLVGLPGFWSQGYMCRGMCESLMRAGLGHVFPCAVWDAQPLLLGPQLNAAGAEMRRVRVLAAAAQRVIRAVGWVGMRLGTSDCCYYVVPITTACVCGRLGRWYSLCCHTTFCVATGVYVWRRGAAMFAFVSHSTPALDAVQKQTTQGVCCARGV